METAVPSVAAHGGGRVGDVQGAAARHRVHAALAQDRHRVARGRGPALEPTG